MADLLQVLPLQTVFALMTLTVLAGAASAQSATAVPKFVMACAPCHGFDGVGYDRSIPNLAGQNWDYLRTQLLAFRSGQRAHPTMSFFSTQMTSDELEQIIGYYAALPAPSSRR